MLNPVVNSARDRLVVDWLSDGGLRVGELCGLHLADLHMRAKLGCAECRTSHLHVCHRDGLVNQARAKTKHEWTLQDGAGVRAGLGVLRPRAFRHSFATAVWTRSTGTQ